MNHHCPVCEKAGLPDYSVTPTICPQCNTDLKPFLLLHSISKSTKAIKAALAALALIGCILAILFSFSIFDNKQIEIKHAKVTTQLQDSLRLLQSAYIELQTEQTKTKATEEEVVILYNVRRGDYLSKIAQFYYGDWRLYKKIEEDNDLTQPYILKVGQLLTIKLEKE